MASGLNDLHAGRRPLPAMAVTPYERVDEVAFSLRPPELAARFGPPAARGRNDVGLEEWDYGERVFRFQASGRLEEVTQRAAVVHLDGVAVPFAALRGFVAGHDREAFERAGYVVSPRFGLAFVPGEPPWVTALARHCIDTWRALPAPATTGTSPGIPWDATPDSARDSSPDAKSAPSASGPPARGER